MQHCWGLFCVCARPKIMTLSKRDGPLRLPFYVCLPACLPVHCNLLLVYGTALFSFHLFTHLFCVCFFNKPFFLFRLVTNQHAQYMSEDWYNMKISGITVVLCCLASLSTVAAFSGTFSNNRPPRPPQSTTTTQLYQAKKAGSFFNEIPPESANNNNNDEEEDKDSIDNEMSELLEQRKQPSLASQPSTINGKPTSGVGFGKKGSSSSTTSTTASNKSESSNSGTTTNKPFIGVGPPVNDPTKPEYDDQGYTLYTSEQTGEKSRVFEALIDYPTTFTMKIVGANEGTFVEEMLQIVAESCNKEDAVQDIPYSTKTMGKWISVTVEAPVDSAEMLYRLYENVDRDPRVKFKF